MKKTVVTIALIPAAALVLSGCSAALQADGGGAGGIRVVASTNVYGDIASTIGGEHVDVKSIIDSVAKDPHSYEASAQDQLAVSKAQLVIQNGGGYDPFIDTLLARATDDVIVVNVTELSGLAPESDEADPDDEGHDHIEGFNEHLWYSLPTMKELAEELADEFSELDEANASTYQANYDAFSTQIDTLRRGAADINTEFAGTGVAITEPVPLYLLEEAGLVNRTPEAFSEAIEEGTDVSPSVLKETLDLFSSGDVGLLAYNDQTSGPETEQVRKTAVAASVPVVSFAETLPDGHDYVSWMTENIDALTKALAA